MSTRPDGRRMALRRFTAAQIGQAFDVGMDVGICMGQNSRPGSYGEALRGEGLTAEQVAQLLADAHERGLREGLRVAQAAVDMAAEMVDEAGGTVGRDQLWAAYLAGAERRGLPTHEPPPLS